MAFSKQYKVSDRVQMVKMDNDPNPILPGTKGTISAVTYISSWNETQVMVKWDNGRTLGVILPEDRIEKI